MAKVKCFSLLTPCISTHLKRNVVNKHGSICQQIMNAEADTVSYGMKKVLSGNPRVQLAPALLLVTVNHIISGCTDSLHYNTWPDHYIQSRTWTGPPFLTALAIFMAHYDIAHTMYSSSQFKALWLIRMITITTYGNNLSEPMFLSGKTRWMLCISMYDT